MDNELKEIILASWLHDIGKFAQRADRQELYNKNLEGIYCKLQKGGWYSHQHVIYTQGFLEKYREVLPDGIDASKVINLAAKHHSPSTYEEWIVAQGDRLSSGADRCSVLGQEETENNSIENDNPAKFYEKPMIHILSSISIEKRAANTAYYKMLPLENDAILATQNKKTSKNEYNDLWIQFEKDFKALQINRSYEDFMQALDSLFERYFWCIPSATNSDADISLYQHAKTTAAFAASLYAFQKECNAQSETALQKSDEKKFLFIKGDFSGIQKYIFDLKSHKDSSRLLRAKSFEIAALGEIISRYIVKSFDMPDANIITSAGGKFMVLLPNTAKTKELLPQVQLETETFFLNEYGGKIAVIISDGVEASEEDVKQGNAQKLINQIDYDADCAKQKKMQKALQKNGAILEAFYEKLQQNGECTKCGIFPATTKDGECEHCSALTNIGANLVKASYVAYKTDKLSSIKDMISISKKEQPHSALINSFEAGKPVVHLPYTVPRNDDESLLSFEEIADKSCGNKKLAMFKADIDNLGLVFSSSLGKRMSFSRYADMSHALHYFFSAYFTHFVQTHSDYKNSIYTVFSGGDDLCIIGAWDKVMHFASDFHKEIEKLTNNNPSLTLSGGIALASSNTPVSIIADMAEEALDKSKSYMVGNTTVKNAITVFDTTVSWADYEKSLEDAKLMQQYLVEKTLSQAVVYKMIGFANRAQKISGGNVAELIDLKAHTWKSNFKYIVVRNVENQKIKDWLLKFGTSKDEMIKSRIAVSYALYTQRTN